MFSATLPIGREAQTHELRHAVELRSDLVDAVRKADGVVEDGGLRINRVRLVGRLTRVQLSNDAESELNRSKP